MKLRLPLLLRLALLSTAAAYTLGSGCLFADDAPADAAQDDPIAEAVDEEESDSPAIGFEGYTESQLVDIQSSDSAGAVIRQMLENSTTGAVANVGTTSSTSNGATAAESPALTLSAPAEPAADTTLTTSTLSDSAGEGAVAPFFSAEEAAALVVASPATSTPSVKNASTATLSSSDLPDETTSSAVANGAVSSSLGSVGSASAGGAGASSGGGSASYSLTSSPADSSSTSLVITTPTDDTSSDPIAEEVLEDSSTETSTTSTILPDSSTSTLATTASSTSSTTTRSLPPLKLLGATGDSVTVSKGNDNVSLGDKSSAAYKSYNVEFITAGKLNAADSSADKSILYFHGNSNNGSFDSMTLTGKQFWLRQAGKDTAVNFEIGSMTLNTDAAEVTFSSNPWDGNKFDITVSTLAVSGSATLKVDESSKEKAVSVTIGSVSGGSLTEVTNSGTLTLGTNANPSKNVDASSVSIGTLTNSGTMTLNGETTITNNLTNTGTLTINSGATLVGKIDSTGTLKLDGVWDLTTVVHSEDLLSNALKSTSQDSLGTVKLNCMSKASDVYRLDSSLSTHGVSLEIVGTSTTYLNAWNSGSKGLLIVEAGSSLTTEGELRLETTAKLQVENDASVKIGGNLTLGHIGGSNYGHVILDGGKLEAKEITHSSDKDEAASDKNTFTMKSGTLTLTKENAEISGVYTEISGGTLDTSQAAWGITSSADGSVSVGRVTVSDVYTTEEGTIANRGNALTLTRANITGDISLVGTADLNLKNVTVTGENVTVGGDNRTISVAEGRLTVEKSVTTKGLLQVQENASLVLLNGDTELVTITKQTNSATAAEFNGGMTLKYDTVNSKGIISGATISNAAIDVSQGSVLALSNSTLNSGVITLNSNAVLELASTADSALAGSIASAENATGTTLRVSGTAVETTLSGTVNVAATEVQSGTLTLSGNSIEHSLGAVTVGSNAELNVGGSSQTLNLSSVVVNEGTLNLSGVTTLSFTLADVVDSVSGGISYRDQLITDGSNNGFIDKYLVIRNQGDGASMTLPELGGLTVNVNSSNRSVSSATSGLYAAASDSDVGEDLNLSNIYVVNEGNVVYNAASNSSGNDTVKQLWLTGGTLELAQSDIKTGVGVHVKQDSTVNIGVDRTLTDSQVSSVENGATLTLTGSGTYSLAVGQIGETALLTSGVALATGESGFTGTVLLNKGTTLNGTDLSALTNGSYSSVTMNGVSGTLKSGAISTNLVLVDYSVEVDKKMVTTKALTINGAGTITFGGTISGSGEMEIAPTADAAENTLIFSGDVRGWTGKLVVAAGKANVTFTGEAKEINAYVADTLSPELNVVVDASESRSFTAGISADTLRLTSGTEGKVVDLKSGSYYVSAKTDLTSDSVILQVKGAKTAEGKEVGAGLYSVLTELAADGSSGINISDGEKTLTTIRTNTTGSSSSGNATLSSCTFTYNNTTGHAEITGYGAVIDRAVIDVVNGSTLELKDVVLTASTWLHDEETTGDGGSTSTYTGSVDLNGVEGKVTGTGKDGGTLQTGTVLTQTGTTGSVEGTKLTLQSDAKVFKIAYSQINQMASIGGTGLTLDFNSYDGGKGFASLYETLNGKYDYVAIEFASTVGEINFSTLEVNAKITNGDGVTGTTTGYYVGGTNGVVNSNGTSGVVVYFDAMALPEPTTSTLGLLALAALCARRRRSRTRAHAE